MPLFSIIIPTYNRGYILQNAIQSIQNQEFEDWELLVVDDGSTDHTDQIMQDLKADPRIIYLKKTNGGASSARNRGLDHAKADWVGYLDSDDLLYAHCLREVHKQIEQCASVSFIVTKAKRFVELLDENGIVLASRKEEIDCSSPSLQDYYDWSVKASLGTGFFHKKNLPARWNESLLLLENLDMMMQCALSDPDGFLYISDDLCEYRQRYGGDGNCSEASYADWGEAFGKIFELHKSDPLMKNPSHYLDRTKRYMSLQTLYERGECLAPQLKYFPEFSYQMSSSPRE